MKKTIFTILVLLLGSAFSQEFEVDGNLKVQGDIIFSDASTMTSASSGIPAGILVPFAGSTAPDGWLLCDGSAVSRTTYSGLFAVIAGTYGAGDGSTTFGLPDLRGRMAMGLDNTGGTSANVVTAETADTLGSTAGEEKHILTEDEMASHSHEYDTKQEGYHANVAGNDQDLWRYVTTASTENTGGDQPHNNMPPYMALNYLIKY